MRFTIKHEIKNRIRLHLPMKRMSFREADTFEYYLGTFPEIRETKVYERTADAVIVFDCDRARAIEIVKGFSFDTVQVPEKVFECSGRELSAQYYDRLVTSVLLHYGKRLILPFDLRRLWVIAKTVKYVWRGLKTLKNKKLQVEMLDAAAITAAVLTGDYNIINSIMTMLGTGGA